MAAGLLLAAMASAGAVSPSPAVGPYSALAEAASYCELRLSKVDFRFTFPRGAMYYLAVDAGVVEATRQMGKSLGPTTADLPALVKRFAATQPMARLSDVGTQRFEYIRFGHDGSYAWTVAHPTAPACDVLVTDSNKPLQERDTLVVNLQQNGWSLGGELPVPEAPFWTVSLNKSITPTPAGATHLVATMQGLGPKADKAGVQMEIQFLASAKN